MDLVKSNGIKLEATSLSLTRRMELDEAGVVVSQLNSAESGMAWWVGDLINQLEAMHGEAYAQVIPEGKESTWMNYKWVAERVKQETRRPTLTWSHHQQVASLLTERQEIYLARAEQEQLTVSALKKLVASDKGRKEKPPKMVECPACHVSFELPK